MSPKIKTLHPKPQPPNLEPQTLNPQPQTLNPEPRTLNAGGITSGLTVVRYDVEMALSGAGGPIFKVAAIS